MVAEGLIWSTFCEVRDTPFPSKRPSDDTSNRRASYP
jgi:hypothetical protein